MTEDPWLNDIPDALPAGHVVTGPVTKITNFGVFVGWRTDLEGLLHISELADHKVEDPQDIVKAGDDVEVKILRVDLEDRKIGLSLKRAQWGGDAGEFSSERQPGPMKGGLGESGGLGTDKITFGGQQQGDENE